MKKILQLISLVMVTLPCLATIRNVPGTYSQIQQAINASVNGDTIVVAPGTYYENINFRGKNVLLTSLFYLGRDTSYVTSTIIDGGSPANPDTASCVIFNSGEDSTAILQGFTIRGGSGTKWLDIHGAGKYREGGGVIIELSSPVVRYNIIRNNQAINVSGVSGAGGGGIRIGDGNPWIENNIITGNQGRYGPGIVLNYTGCRIRNNVIEGNSGASSFSGGGGIWMYGNHNPNFAKIIENNTIINNFSTSPGSGGIALLSATNIFIRNNIVWGNSPSAQQILTSGATATVAYCDVQGGFTGTGNLNEDPLTGSGCFTLDPGSPCIDAGDTNTVYDDLLAAPGVALFPSMGTETNDMGAFGGPGAFLLNCRQWTTGIEIPRTAVTGLRVYPNPASGRLVVERTSAGSTAESAELLNLSGQRVRTVYFTSTTTVIDISDLPDGIYLIREEGSGAVEMIKIIKVSKDH
jgi:hypothetical protein